MEVRSDMMGTMPMGKLIGKMSFPLMISMLIQSTYNVVDSIFVARLGIEAIAAIGIAFPIQMLMIGMANGLGVGMNALIAQRFGRREHEKAGMAAGNNILLTGILVLIFMLFAVFAGAYVRASNPNELIVRYGIEYLEWICLGSVGIFGAILFGRLLQVTGKTTLSMISQLSGAIVNIVLDPILIFGYFGLPAMGIRGAAIATLAGQFISLGLALFMNVKMNPDLRIRRSDLRLNRDIIPICKVGFPVAVTMGMSSVLAFFMNTMLAAYSVSLAVFTIFYKLQSFFFMPIGGLVQGLTPIIGYNFGAQKGDRLKEAIRFSLLGTLCIMVVGFLLCQLAPGAIIGLFDDGKTPELITVGITAIRTISWTFPIAGLAMVGSNVFQGMGDGVPSLVYGLGRQCVFLLPAAWLILQYLGVDFVWYAFWIGEGLTACLVFFLFLRDYRRLVEPLLARNVCENEV